MNVRSTVHESNHASQNRDEYGGVAHVIDLHEEARTTASQAALRAVYDERSRRQSEEESAEYLSHLQPGPQQFLRDCIARARARGARAHPPACPHAR